MEKLKTVNSKWYIIRTTSNREKGISEKIDAELKRGDLIGKVSQVIVPIEYSFFMKNGKKVKREKVMFPGYIFAESSAPGELKEYLKTVKGASGLLTNRLGEIQALTETEVKRMMGVQEEIKSKTESDNHFIPSEEVVIVDGPFSSMRAIIEDIFEERVKLTVSIFGRKTPMELSIYQISKI
jgi:transcription termination/antitermination protein NusG